MRKRMSAMALVALLGVPDPGPGAETAAQVNFPERYRDWTHTTSMVIQEGHFLAYQFAGIHHIYANQKALAALKAKTPCPDGSVFVFDLLAARHDANAILEGARKLVAVMEKDGKRFAKTGGWGYEIFRGDTRQRTVTDGGAGCHACHRSRRSHDHVFHEWRP
jgi:Cytochrome P460